MRARDTQRKRVYDSEREAFTYEAPVFGDLAETQGFVDEVVGSRWWVGRYAAPVVVTVEDGRGRRRGGASGSHISLPRWTRMKWYALHELAHLVTSPMVAPHGPEFCREYLALVSRWLGREAATTLRASMRVHRVKRVVRS